MTIAAAGGETALWREKAFEIADRLAREAIWHGDLCTFHGVVPPDQLGEPPKYRSCRGDVYEGSTGVARFLALSATLGGNATHRETAIGAIRHGMSCAEGWSLFGGKLGTGLVALEISGLFDLPDLHAEACAMIDSAASEALARHDAYDFLIGSAGVIAGLTGSIAAGQNEGWPLFAKRLGSALLEKAEDSNRAGPHSLGLSWPMTDAQDDHLCGLAHGASGAALAFSMLARLDEDDDRWRVAASQARQFERAHFSAEAGSWADLRGELASEEGGDPSYPHMWCHGSVGIAAERLLAIGGDRSVQADAIAGLAGARSFAERLIDTPRGPGGSDAINGSLCHGLGAFIDLFVDAYGVSGDASWLDLAAALAEVLIDDARRDEGWRSGVPGGDYSPGLMLGVSGIGWALLRVSQPHDVNSGWRVFDTMLVQSSQKIAGRRDAEMLA